MSSLLPVYPEWGAQEVVWFKGVLFHALLRGHVVRSDFGLRHGLAENTWRTVRWHPRVDMENC